MKFLKILFLSILIVLCSVQLHAQKPIPIDSMLKELPRKKEDSNKVKLLNLLSASYSSKVPDKGILYAQQSIDLATKLEWEDGIAAANISLAGNYKAKPDNEKEIACLFIALNHYKQIDNKKGIVTATQMIAANYRRTNNYSSALEYYTLSLKLAENQGLKQQVADNADGISEIYYKQGNYSSALEYGFQEMKLMEELGNKAGIEHAENAIGRIYVRRGDYTNATTYLSKALQLAEELHQQMDIANIATNLGNTHFFQKNYPEATRYYNKSLEASEQVGDTGKIARSICCIGAVYQLEGNYLMAAEHFQIALKIFEARGEKDQIGANLCNVGDAYIAMAKDGQSKQNLPLHIDDSKLRLKLMNGTPLPQIPKGRAALVAGAVDHYQRALVVLKEIKHLEFMKNCYQALSEAYKLQGDYKTAMACSDSGRAIQDTLFNQENTKKIVEQEMKYMYGKREDSIKLANAVSAHASALKLQRQRSYTIIGLCGVVALLVFSYFIVNNYRTQKRLNATISKLVNEQEETIKQRTEQLLVSNQKLEHANAKLIELIQYNAHNLREPLTRVMGAMMLQEIVTYEEFYDDIWPEMHRAVNDLDDRIKNVISIADQTVDLYK